MTHFLSVLPHDVRHVFEFRHDSWFKADVFFLLRLFNDGFCAFHMMGWEGDLSSE